MRGEAGDAAEGAGEVALIGEAYAQADSRKRKLRIEEIPGGSADAQAVRVLADAFSLEAAEDPREVHRMNAGFGAEFIEGQSLRVFGVQLFDNPREPCGRLLAFLQRQTRGEGGEFGEQALNAKSVGLADSKRFAEELYGQPEHRPATRVFGATLQIA